MQTETQGSRSQHSTGERSPGRGAVRAATAARWKIAQAGEARYWEHARSSLREQARILAEKLAALDQVTEAVPDLMACHGQKVEVGIGPMGIGMLHFLSTRGPLVGVDPLPAVRAAVAPPRPLDALLEECRRDYTHLQGRGEALPIETGSTAVAACYNVLDHVESPAAVLGECYRVVRPGGFFILGCDTVSITSLLKFRIYTSWRHRATLSVICHPFRFQPQQLEQLVRDAGFEIVWVLRRDRERWQRLAGHAFRLLMVARKPSSATQRRSAIAEKGGVSAPNAEENECRSILLSHPGGQHSERLAMALDNAGLLRRFVTGVHWNAKGLLGRALSRFPGRHAKYLAQRFARRSFPGLARERVAARPLAEGAYLLAMRWPAGRRQGERLVAWRNFIFDRSVARSLERERPAGVICFDTCALETFRAARRLGIRTILDESIAPLAAVRERYLREADLWPEFADSLRRDLSPAYFAREAQELRLADCVFAPSAFVRRAVEDLGVPSHQIADVPYGVDLQTFVPGPRKSGKTFRVLFVGKLTQRKGLAQLLEAFRWLNLPGAQLELVGSLVGSGRWLPRYRDLFEWHPEAAHADLAERYHQADVFVLPSLHEGSALVTYEALASGLPVITTPQTGSVVRDGVEGFVVPAGEIEPLAERLLELFRDPERRREMGARARQRAEEFSWAAYDERVAAAIHRALGSGNEQKHAVVQAYA
jgi:alpha-maltose-1-phosphate synthase